VNSTIGFEKLAIEVNKPSKSLHRIFTPSGNPTMENLFQIIHVIRESKGIDFELNAYIKKPTRT
jgi:DNA-binding phage protein